MGSLHSGQASDTAGIISPQWGQEPTAISRRLYLPTPPLGFDFNLGYNELLPDTQVVLFELLLLVQPLQALTDKRVSSGANDNVHVADPVRLPLRPAILCSPKGKPSVFLL